MEWTSEEAGHRTVTTRLFNPNGGVPRLTSPARSRALAHSYSSTEATMDTTEELRRFNGRMDDRQEVISATIGHLQRTWRDCSGETWVPRRELLAFLMTQYHPDILDEAIAVTANKVLTGTVSKDGTGWYYYLMGVAKNIARENRQPLLTTEDIEDA